MASQKRRDMDIMKLMMSDYVVEMDGDGADFYVQFHGPKDTYYEGGIWKVHVTLPKDYPYRSPSIGFKNKIYHPNVDETSGSVCLDVINQTWSPMYELLNIFDMFLPQLLSYPNASDPLNSNAASLLLQEPEKYEAKVKDFVQKYASPGNVKKTRHASTGSDISVSTERSSASSCTCPSTTSPTSSSSSLNPSSSSSSTTTTTSMEIDNDDDDDDDLSSLSDESDCEDSLELDL